MIDLNKNNAFDKQYIKIEDIYKYANDYQIFKHYLPDGYEPGDGSVCSPLRNDNIPSFSVFYGTRNQKYMYKDFSTGESGDCIVFVRKLFEAHGQILTYNETLIQIIKDLNLPLLKFSDNLKSEVKQRVLPRTKPKTSSKSKIKLGINARNWQKQDKIFWTQFGITKNTLEYYNVKPVKRIFYNIKLG